MENRAFQVVAIIGVAILAGAAGLTVMATGSDSDGQNGGILAHLHQAGSHGHGGGHHQNPMAAVIEELELTPEQQHRLEKLHQIFAAYHEGPGPMAALHNELVEQFERGRLETDEIRRAIDAQLDEMREMAYAGTDELVALVNGLDARQREILSNHLQEARAAHDSHAP